MIISNRKERIAVNITENGELLEQVTFLIFGYVIT